MWGAIILGQADLEADELLEALRVPAPRAMEPDVPIVWIR
jgi:hypothetical protein